MDITDQTIKQIILSSWTDEGLSVSQTQSPSLSESKTVDWLHPLRNWLNNLEIRDSRLAHHLCFLIPAQCPFARKVQLFGHRLVDIPPLCKLNPFYDELMTLRFRALSYLADECGEDISSYY
jgi:hypothetical protein